MVTKGVTFLVQIGPKYFNQIQIYMRCRLLDGSSYYVSKLYLNY